MKTFFFLLMCGLCTATLSAQSLTGTVTDADRRPVEAATVVLQTADSTYIDATLTDSLGAFRFEQRPERYRLIVEHLIYNTCIREGSGTDADTLVLTPRDYALDEVTVRGERALVKVEGSRLTYDVAQIAASRLVTNAYEALLQLPGVVEKDGVPALAGSGSLGIVLNGKPSSMSAEQVIALLKATPASRMERAEVMYSAPPQYHVRGAAVNLVLKGYKAGEGGLQGEVNGNYVQKDEAGGNGGVTLAWLSPRWDVDKIIARRRRKRLLTANARRFEEFGAYNHETMSSRNFANRVYACTAPADPGNYYAVFNHQTLGQTLLVFTPNDRVLESLRSFIPRQAGGKAVYGNRPSEN